ncbi:hypothetical protein E1295_10360 [Nonomuraea mesophila]|uniref:Uncharacterized protein n=1 Tax=Nonomuraea mesophila TaxID=2530382 RepID=A0A4R5FT42_9ACTN|nr:hypothetical protein E1295_10360 [Nonomuraea mesophila]
MHDLALVHGGERADGRYGCHGGVLPWTLLGKLASLAANVAVAEPILVGRVIAAQRQHPLADRVASSRQSACPAASIPLLALSRF